MKRVLVINDDQSIKDFYRWLLIETGWLVRQASQARRSTNVLIRAEIDLAVIDFKMPEVNGKALIEIIKEDDPQLKVIVSTVCSVDQNTNESSGYRLR